MLADLLAKCFFPARWTVSMSRVSKTGLWKQTVQEYLEKGGRKVGPG